MQFLVKLMTRGDKQLEFNACTNIYTHRPRQSFAGPRMLALYVNERARHVHSASFETKRLPLITGASPSSEVWIPTFVAAMPSALETAPSNRTM